MAPVNLLKAIHSMRENITIVKTGKNTYHNNEYITLENILGKLKDSKDYGILWTQYIEEPILYTVICHDESGESITSTFELPAGKPQERAASVTYYRRIALVTMFGLSEPDDDGNAANKMASRSSPGRDARGGSGQQTPPAEPLPPFDPDDFEL